MFALSSHPEKILSKGSLRENRDVCTLAFKAGGCIAVLLGLLLAR